MPAAVNEVMHSEEEEGPTIVDKMRSAVYKMFFHPDNPISTPKGFEKLLASLPDNTKVLDVGCGDCLYYTEPSICQLIKDKQLVIKGVDIDAGAVAIGSSPPDVALNQTRYWSSSVSSPSYRCLRSNERYK